LSSQAWHFNSPVIEIVLSAETSDRTTKLFPSHLDARPEGGRLLPNLQPDRERGGLLARWIVLPLSQAKESKSQQNHHGQSHSAPQFEIHSRRRENMTNADTARTRG
jgi:hypothetical protein